MPYLIQRRVRNRQPQQDVRINWDNPLTRGLVDVIDMRGVPRSLILGTPPTFFGSSQTYSDPTPSGLAFSTLASVGGVAFIRSDGLYAPAEQTHVALAEYVISGGSWTGLFVAADGSGASGSFGLQRYSGTQAVIGGTASLYPFIYYNLAGVGQNLIVLTGDSTTAKVYKNGDLLYSGTCSPVAQSTSRLVLSGERTASTSYAHQSRQVLHLFYSRAIKADEVLSLQANIWQIFEDEEDYIWVPDAGAGTTSVSSNDAESYFVRSAALATDSEAYAIRGAVYLDSACAFTIRTEAQASSAVSYNVKAEAQASATSGYNVLGQVQGSSTAAYSVRSIVYGDSSPSYNIGLVAVSDGAAAYIIRASISEDSAVAFSINSYALSDNSALFNIKAGVTSDQGTSYTILTYALVDNFSTFSIRGQVLEDASTAYFIKSYLYSDNVLEFSIQTSINYDSLAIFNIKALVSSDSASAYSMRTSVQQEVASAYLILNAGAVTSSSSAGYNIRGVASEQGSESYNIRTSAISSGVVGYSIRGEVGSQATSSYSVDSALLAVFANSTCAYSVLSDVSSIRASSKGLYPVTGVMQLTAITKTPQLSVVVGNW